VTAGDAEGAVGGRPPGEVVRAVRTSDRDEIAALMAWLGCAEAVNVNGAVITSDGGFTS
jgi:NAD(P)-dependent dehydrogenase (short-subunit alcohol dehydrogenase family)